MKNEAHNELLARFSIRRGWFSIILIRHLIHANVSIYLLKNNTVGSTQIIR